MKLDKLTETSAEDSDLYKTPAPGKLGNYITTAQTAKLLNVTMSRVRQLIMDGNLKAYSPEKGRRDNMLKKSEVVAYKLKDQKPAGRPPETKEKDKSDK